MLRRLSGAVVAATLLLATLVPVASAADVEFGEPSATATFGEGIEFVQPVTLGEPATRVEVRLTFTGGAAPLVVELPPVPAGAQILRYTFVFADGGYLLPNTRIDARWRVYGGPDDRAGTDGPPAAVRYADDRFDWQTVSGDVVRVHWYEGTDAFGQRALEIGEAAVRDTAELLGVTEEEPIDFFVYASEDTFYDALGPGTRENVGGQANAEIRTLFALITPGEIDDPWVSVVVPHELVHLVFDTAVKNPYHFPPRWLNEGLAVYLSEGYGPLDRAAMDSAVAGASLIPLDGLSGQFPTSADAFRLAYSESVSAVDYLIRTYGQDALVALIRSYAEGRTDDEAFRDALGVDVPTFAAAWLDDLGAEPPQRFGPQPAPDGPEPAEWTGGGGGGGAGATPGPDAPIRTPAASPPDDGAPAPAGDGGLPVGVIAVLVVAIVLLFGAGVAVRRRRA